MTARKTIAQKVTEERKANGQVLLGQTSGIYSFRKNSNLYHKLIELGFTENEVDVRTAARAGQHWNDGYELLIFSKGREKMIIIELTNSGNCGSATVYTIDYSKEVAIELMRTPWNKTSVSHVLNSELKALRKTRELYPTAKIGSVPGRFEIKSEAE